MQTPLSIRPFPFVSTTGPKKLFLLTLFMAHVASSSHLQNTLVVKSQYSSGF